MKVVLISNFAEESVAESLHKEGLDEIQAEQEAKEWNEKNCHDHSTYFAVVKSDDYRLWRGMVDLVKF